MVRVRKLNPYPYPGWPYPQPGGFYKPVTITTSDLPGLAQSRDLGQAEPIWAGPSSGFGPAQSSQKPKLGAQAWALVMWLSLCDITMFTTWTTLPTTNDYHPTTTTTNNHHPVTVSPCHVTINVATSLSHRRWLLNDNSTITITRLTTTIQEGPEMCLHLRPMVVSFF